MSWCHCSKLSVVLAGAQMMFEFEPCRSYEELCKGVLFNCNFAVSKSHLSAKWILSSAMFTFVQVIFLLGLYPSPDGLVRMSRPNVGKYTIHGSYGYWQFIVSLLPLTSPPSPSASFKIPSTGFPQEKVSRSTWMPIEVFSPKEPWEYQSKTKKQSKTTSSSPQVPKPPISNRD